MTDLEKIIIQRACEELVLRAHLYTDRCEHDKIMGLFAPDIVIDHVVVGTMSGTAAVQKYYDAKITTIVGQHNTSNIIIDVIDGDNATGVAYYAFYYAAPGTKIPAPLNGPAVVGYYTDKFKRVNGQWKFAYRKMTNTFQAGPMDNINLIDKKAMKA